MQKKFSEIMDMIKNGQLHYNQSTQRKFVYADMDAQLPCGKTTKSGSLINAILEDNIQLPAIYFWHNTDTGMLNIHDGKQRLLSLYYFINPTAYLQISTIRNSKTTTWDGLSAQDQDKLLNYTFDIVERSGTSLEEERSFYLINTNPVALTMYECLSGMFYGPFLRGFEDYVEAMSKTYDAVKAIGRGEQAYKFLLAMFSLSDAKKSGAARADLLLNDEIRKVRNNQFDAEAYSFDQILITFNELSKVVKGLKEERALAIAAYIIRSGYSKDSVVDLYRRCMRCQNDISSWDMATHKTFINAFTLDKIELDPQRNFDKTTKDILYARDGRCKNIDENGKRCTETSYSKLEVDHITPWSKGGRTSIDNAQLLCKHHNTSKGNED